MKKSLWIVLLLALICTLALSACDDTNKPQTPNEDHVHAFGEWTTIKKANCTEDGINERYCSCGEKQTQTIVALGHEQVIDAAVAPACTATGLTEGKHCSVCNEVLLAQTIVAAKGHTEVVDKAVAATCTTDGKTEGKHCSRCNTTLVAQTTIGNLGHVEVIDAAVSATCTTDGKTEGKHCSRCNATLVAQTTIGKLGHVEVIDAAVAATCTADGKTEGKHCSRCSTILISQSVVSSTGHQYNSGEITTQATCNQSGVKTFTCTVNNCRHSYTETYSLPTYTATELYNLSVKYVGEIVTYDKSGAKLALGTGFVISSDGKIVTNYHVIEGAYSADITINDKKYTISSILAYDANIDLAVLKINATGLTAATVCKNPVSVGATVYAIGSSRGMTNTYSQGIITYADRIVEGVSHVQHDASITHGNSGGPLINVYGEVIGINTWGISDSQNLNFAVFAGELDNLIYGTPITLSELFQEQLTPYEILLDWLITNQNRQGSSMICYDYWQGTTMYTLGYDPKNDYMCVMINDGSFMLLLDLDCDPSEYYYIWDWELESPADYYKVTGTINAYTYTTDTVLRNYNYTSGIYLEEAKVVPMAQISISLAIAYLQNILLTHPEMGLSIADFGFISFD